MRDGLPILLWLLFATFHFGCPLPNSYRAGYPACDKAYRQARRPGSALLGPGPAFIVAQLWPLSGEKSSSFS
jgi:hypothetical protein